MLAAAAVRGGTEPDLLDEVASWQADDFWHYATYAAVAHIRAAASRADVPVRQACQELDERPGYPAPADSVRLLQRSPNLATADRSSIVNCSLFQRSTCGAWVACRIPIQLFRQCVPPEDLLVKTSNVSASRFFKHQRMLLIAMRDVTY